MTHNTKWFPLKLTWAHKFSLLSFDYKKQQLDDFALMMAGLCQEGDLYLSRVSTLVTELFEIHNRLYCSTETTTKKVSSDVLEKSESLMREIDGGTFTELDTQALTVCSEATDMKSWEYVWKYLTAALHGFRAEISFMAKEIYEGNKHYMEMLKIIQEAGGEVFEQLDLAYMVLDHCSQLLNSLWNDNGDHWDQLDYLLLVTKHLLDHAKLGDDMDGIKYQGLRKYWHLLVGVNEGHFIEKSWKVMENYREKVKDETAHAEPKLLECHVFSISLPEAPAILSRTTMTTSDHFLSRLKILEEHQVQMKRWGAIQINDEQNSIQIMTEILKYAETAYEAVKNYN